MNLRDVLRKRDNERIITLPEIPIGKYWSIELGEYQRYEDGHWKQTPDWYAGVKFRITW